MSIEDKLKRYRQIQRLVYPTDEELDEKEQLEEELKSYFKDNDEFKPISSNVPKNTATDPRVELSSPMDLQPKKNRGNILRKILFVKPKEPPKPVTEAELADLTMVARKEELKARIAKAKANQQKAGGNQSIFKTIQKVIGTTDHNPFDMSSGSRKRSDDNLFR